MLYGGNPSCRRLGLYVLQRSQCIVSVGLFDYQYHFCSTSNVLQRKMCCQVRENNFSSSDLALVRPNQFQLNYTPLCSLVIRSPCFNHPVLTFHFAWSGWLKVRLLFVNKGKVVLAFAISGVYHKHHKQTSRIKAIAFSKKLKHVDQTVDPTYTLFFSRHFPTRINNIFLKEILSSNSHFVNARASACGWPCVKVARF